MPTFNRREFVKGATAATAALALPTIAKASPELRQAFGDPKASPDNSRDEELRRPSILRDRFMLIHGESFVQPGLYGDGVRLVSNSGYAFCYSRANGCVCHHCCNHVYPILVVGTLEEQLELLEQRFYYAASALKQGMLPLARHQLQRSQPLLGELIESHGHQVPWCTSLGTMRKSSLWQQPPLPLNVESETTRLVAVWGGAVVGPFCSSSALEFKQVPGWAPEVWPRPKHATIWLGPMDGEAVISMTASLYAGTLPELFAEFRRGLRSVLDWYWRLQRPRPNTKGGRRIQEAVWRAVARQQKMLNEARKGSDKGAVQLPLWRRGKEICV